MAVIKDAQARDMARQAVVLDLGDLSRQASTILDQARREAEKGKVALEDGQEADLESQGEAGTRQEFQAESGGAGGKDLAESLAGLGSDREVEGT